MLRTLLTPAFLSLAPLLAVGQTPPKPGERLPPVELTGLEQTSAKTFSDYYGRAVLLEFFAYWCGPCAQSVPHMNEMQKEYEARGLSIIGVTAEGAKKTVPWIQKYGVEYAYGYDASNALHRLFQINSIPFAVLLDPEGVVVWSGHPMRLSKEKIERALENSSTKPVWNWPEPARALAARLQKGEFAAALEQAKKLGASDGFDPAVVVQERVRLGVAQFERLIQRGDYTEGFELVERLKKDYAGLPEGESLTARAAALRADPEVLAGLAAHGRLLELEQRAAAVRNSEEGQKLRAEIEAFLKEAKGKRIEKRTQALLDSIDHALENAKKHEKS